MTLVTAFAIGCNTLASGDTEPDSDATTFEFDVATVDSAAELFDVDAGGFESDATTAGSDAGGEDGGVDAVVVDVESAA